MSMTNIESMKQNNAVLWWSGSYAESGAYDDDGNKRGFLILPDGVTVTPTGTFTTQKMKDGRNVWYFNSATPNYVILTTNAAFDFGSGDFTITFWVKASAYTGSQSILNRRASVTYAPFSLAFNNGTPTILTYGASTSGTAWDVFINSSSACVAEEWNHFAIVRSGSVITMYKNNVSVGTSSGASTNALMASTSGVAIATSNTDSPTSHLTGNIKDLMIFKGKALTQDQIAAIMAETYIY